MQVERRLELGDLQDMSVLIERSCGKDNCMMKMFLNRLDRFHDDV
jgi:hypothetical protein